MFTVHKFVRRYRKLMLFAVITAFSVGALVFVVWPQAQKMYDVYRDSQKLTTEVALLEARSAFLRTIDETQLREDLKTLTTAVPIAKDVPSIFSTVEQVLIEKNIGVVDMSLKSVGSLEATTSAFTKDETRLGSSLLPLTVNAVGTWESLHDFLQKIIAVRRLLRVSSVSYKTKEESSGSAVLVFELQAPYAPISTPPIDLSSDLVVLTGKESQILQRVSIFPAFTGGVSSEVPSSNAKTDPFAP
ncbi:MAG: type 4a pilus biogenesis protein PilO [bacterium]|nr:type 4a pilus biogenesis protein PilO [bacterium]